MRSKVPRLVDDIGRWSVDDPARVVVGDPQLLFADGVSAIMEHAGYQVLGVVARRVDVVTMVADFRPQLCLVENLFPEGSISEVVGELVASAPACAVVVITADDDPTHLLAALDAGASGYVSKTRGSKALLSTLLRVLAGETVIEGSFVRAGTLKSPTSGHFLRLANYLTQREFECLRLLVGGLSTQDISRQLGVSTTTVRSHVAAVLTKLGAHSRLEAVSLAVRHGLVDSANGPPRLPVASGR